MVGRFTGTPPDTLASCRYDVGVTGALVKIQPEDAPGTGQHVVEGKDRQVVVAGVQEAICLARSSSRQPVERPKIRTQRGLIALTAPIRSKNFKPSNSRSISNK
jgi:hypothetical protein